MRKSFRVKKEKDFDAIFKEGKSVANRKFVIYRLENQQQHFRVGLSVSKKLGNAVHRNLYKRQVRMMCHELVDFKNTNYDMVLIIRFNYSSLSYEENKNNLEKLLIKAKIK